MVPTASVFWIGDSIIAGAGGGVATSPPDLLGILSGKVVRNGGTNGDRIPACVTKWTNARASGLQYETLIWSCGVNSFSDDVTGAAAWALVEPVLSQAKSDGLRVIMTEVMPWKNATGWTAPRSAEADAYFVLAQAWCTANSEHCVPTKASMGGQGGDPEVLLTAYNSGDSIHPSYAGQLQLATLVNAESP